MRSKYRKEETERMHAPTQQHAARPVKVSRVTDKYREATKEQQLHAQRRIHNARQHG